MNNSYLILLLLLLISCKSKMEEKAMLFGDFGSIEKEWSVDSTRAIAIAFPQTASSHFGLSEYVDTSWSIALETKPESLIGSIDKIIAHEGILYLLDIRKSRKILAFDLSGKYLFTVGKQEDRQSFTHPSDFSIDKNNGTIVVYEDHSQRLFYYTLEGKFLEEKNLDFLLYGLASLEDGTSILHSFGRSNPNYQGTSFRLIQINESGEIERKGLPYPPAIENLAFIPSRFELSTFGEEVIYSPSFQGKIYSVNSSSISLKYQIDFGQRSLPKDYVEMDSKSFVKQFWTKGKTEHVVFTGAVYETESLLFFYLGIGASFKSAIYSKASGTINYGDLEDDLPHSLETQMIYGTYEDQYLIGGADSYFLTQGRPKYSNSKSTEIVQLLEDLSPTDNPVLSIYKLK